MTSDDGISGIDGIIPEVPPIAQPGPAVASKPDWRNNDAQRRRRKDLEAIGTLLPKDEAAPAIETEDPLFLAKLSPILGSPFRKWTPSDLAATSVATDSDSEDLAAVSAPPATTAKSRWPCNVGCHGDWTGRNAPLAATVDLLAHADEMPDTDDPESLPAGDSLGELPPGTDITGCGE